MTDTNQLPPLPEPTKAGHLVSSTPVYQDIDVKRIQLEAFTAGELQSRAQLAQGEPVTDAEIVAALEAAGVKFQRFMGGISGTKDCWSTAGSQDVRKLLAGVRAILALRPAAQEVCPTCHETEPHTGSCGTSDSDTKALCKRTATQKATPTAAATCPNCEGYGYTDLGEPDSPDVPGRPAVVCGSCKGYGWRDGVHWSDQQQATQSDDELPGMWSTSDLIGGETDAQQATPEPSVTHELLDAMSEVIRISDRQHEAWDKAKAAISMLRGKELPAPTPEPVHPDDLAVDRFAAAMKAKLAASRAKSRGGWDDPEQCTVEHLARLLVDHIPKGDPVDVANFAMMLHQRGADRSVLATATPEPVGDGFVIAPHFRGYANLGIGAYVLNHSAAGYEPELVISIATEEERAGRAVGEEIDNTPGALIHPDQMAVRLRFENVVGLDALEKQLYGLREVHFADTRPAPAAQAVPMTVDQAWHSDTLMAANGIAGFKMDALMRIVRAVEAHHGITAQAKGGE